MRDEGVLLSIDDEVMIFFSSKSFTCVGNLESLIQMTYP